MFYLYRCTKRNRKPNKAVFFAFQNHNHDVAFDVSKIKHCNRFHKGARLLPIFCQYAVQGQRDKSCILFKGKIAMLTYLL